MIHWLVCFHFWYKSHVAVFKRIVVLEYPPHTHTEKSSGKGNKDKFYILVFDI